MKYLFTVAVVAGAIAGFSGAANAAGGCGPGFHRGYHGACRPNYGPHVVVPPHHRVCPPDSFWRHGRCRHF